jgi:hypothetical protein
MFERQGEITPPLGEPSVVWRGRPSSRISCLQPVIDHPSNHTIRDSLVKKVSKLRVRYRIKVFFDLDIDHPPQSLAHQARAQIW